MDTKKPIGNKLGFGKPEPHDLSDVLMDMGQIRDLLERVLTELQGIRYAVEK